MKLLVKRKRSFVKNMLFFMGKFDRILERRCDFDAAAELTPALLVLNKLVLASEESRLAVKEAIFPPEADKVKDR